MKTSEQTLRRNRLYKALKKEELRIKNQEWYAANQETILAKKKAISTTPRLKYDAQKEHARRRGIPWIFTFDTWWDVWNKSGKWEFRGRKRDEYCMCRYGDAGPYSPLNVRIDTCANNRKERNVPFLDRIAEREDFIRNEIEDV